MWLREKNGPGWRKVIELTVENETMKKSTMQQLQVTKGRRCLNVNVLEVKDHKTQFRKAKHNWPGQMLSGVPKLL